MQDILAILISLAAAVFLARRAWQRVVYRRAGACGSCADCNSKAGQHALISLSTIVSHATAQRREDKID